MKKILQTALIAAACAAAPAACTQEEIIFDQPFVYITNSADEMTSTLNCKGSVIESYTVYMSSKLPGKDIEVYFKVVVGDGLQDGVDYTLLTLPSEPLVFPNGTFQRDIRIQWLPHVVDSSKDNTLKIILTGSNADLTLGMPGPAENFKQHTITKVLIN